MTTIQPDRSRGEHVCAKCGAIGRGGADVCWLCGAKVKNTQDINPFQAPVTSSELPADLTKVGSMTGIVLGTAYLFVSIAILSILPGPGMLLLVFSAPAIVRSWKIRKKREARGMEVTPTQQALLFVGSFFAISVSVILVFVAAFGTFCGVCLTAAGTGIASEESVILVAFAAAALAGLLAIFATRRFLGAQWRRDTYEDQDG